MRGFIPFILTIIFFCLTSQGEAAITRTAKGTGYGTGTLTLSNVTIANGASIIVTGNNGGTSTPSSITWNGIPLRRDQYLRNTDSSRSWIYSLHNVTGATGNLVVTPPLESNTIAFCVSQYTNLEPCPIETSVSLSGSSTSPSSDNVTTTWANCVLVASISVSSTDTGVFGAWGNGFSSDQYISGNNEGYRIVSSAGTYAASQTLNSSTNWSVTMVAYREKGNIVVTPKGTGATVASSLTIPSITIANGASIIVSVTIDSTTFVSITWNSNNLTSDVEIMYPSHARTAIWSLHNVSGATGNVVITISESQQIVAVVAEATGLAATSTKDKTASAYDRVTTPSSGATATTTQSDELLWGAIGCEAALDWGGTWDNYFTEVGKVGPDASIKAAFRNVTATGAYTASMTGASRQYFSSTIVTYKKASAAPAADTSGFFLVFD